MNEYEQIQKQLEAYRQTLPEVQEEWPPKIRKAYSCMITYLFDPRLNISWMRTKCYINGHNFAVKFRHCTGMSPNTFKNHHRLEAAKYLLSDSRFEDFTVSDVAAEVGFSSISAFSKSFNQNTGMNPSQWREEQMET